MKKYYEADNCLLLEGDCIKIMEKIDEKSINMIFADPPYYLSNNGISCHSGRQVSVNKGSWDQGLNRNERHNFNKRWINLAKRILRDDGTIWISGTFHNIYSVGMALEENGFKIINNITLQKTNPAPNLACRCFTHSTETILWAKKDLKKVKHYFDYEKMKQQNNNKQMKDVWTGSTLSKNEKKFGKHPTQKPLYLLNRIIECSTKEGDLVLDCFNGSGTTGVAALSLNRHYIGIEKEKEFLELSKNRLKDILEKRREL